MIRMICALLFAGCMLFLATNLIAPAERSNRRTQDEGELLARAPGCTIQVTVARTAKERERGVAAWASLPLGRGMLFRSGAHAKRKDIFWNRGVGFPVMVVFVDQVGSVGDLRLLAPDARTKITSRTPFAAALEVSPRTVEHCRIAVGSQLEGIERAVGA